MTSRSGSACSSEPWPGTSRRNPKSAPGSPNVEEAPSAECPIGPGSTRPSQRSGARRTRHELGARGTSPIRYGSQRVEDFGLWRAEICGKAALEWQSGSSSRASPRSQGLRAQGAYFEFFAWQYPASGPLPHISETYEMIGSAGAKRRRVATGRPCSTAENERTNHSWNSKTWGCCPN
jgi:hypothetical protein